LYTLGITRSAQEDKKKKYKCNKERGEKRKDDKVGGVEERGVLYNSSVSTVMQPQLR